MPENPRHKPDNYSDQEKLCKKRESLAIIRDILEYTGDETDLVEVVKSVNPAVSPVELIDLIKLFHASVREKRGGGRGSL